MTVCLLLIFAFLFYNEAAGPTWGAWGVWSDPCTSCPGAISRGRTRVCVPGDDFSLCSGPRLEVENCVNCVGQWTEWVDGTECPDTCGNCGRLTRTRQCRNAVACPTPTCTGNGSDLSPATCDSGDVCTFPRSPCCEGSKAVDIARQRFYCKRV
ncbi:hypothetical protein OSTOST_00540 [Ostertagia ostertagi]